MTILLVQHGEAKTKEEDPDRSLTVSGTRITKKVASWLGKHDVNIQEILHSGKKRAAETAEIFANRLAPAKGVTVVSGMNPNDDVRAFAEQLVGQDGVFMVVGHLPFLDRLASFLVTGEQDKGIVAFANSGVVCLIEEKGAWSVAWAVTPELLVEA